MKMRTEQVVLDVTDQNYWPDAKDLLLEFEKAGWGQKPTLRLHPHDPTKTQVVAVIPSRREINLRKAISDYNAKHAKNQIIPTFLRQEQSDKEKLELTA